ncbi:ArsR/SmtB family transcription factor [Thalassiella azotivora]
MADVFKALADPTRRALLDELADRDDQTLFELCARLSGRHGISPSRQAVSQHLDVLAAAGLLHRRREGRYTLHSLDPTPLRGLTDRWTGGPDAPPAAHPAPPAPPDPEDRP